MRLSHNPGQEVSNRAVLVNMEACRIQGADPRPLLSTVFGDQQHKVLEPSGRCSWEAYTRFLEGIEALLGGPAAIEKMTFDYITTNPAMGLLASLLLNLEQTYFFTIERMDRHMYRGIPLNIRRIGDGRLRLEYSVPPTLRACSTLFPASIGAVRAHPRNLGLPEALVDAQGDDRTGVFLITLPESRDIATRTRAKLVGAAKRVVSIIAGPSDLDILPAVFDDGPLLEVGQELGDELLRLPSVDAVADRLLEWLASEFGTRWMRISIGRSTVIERGESDSDAYCSRALTLGDRQIGRLEVDRPTPLGEEPPLLRGALPWVAAVFDRLANDDIGDRWTRLVEERAREWRLPARQREALQLLARGCSNKEIATALGCSVKGVEAHVTRLLSRASVGSRAELISRLGRQGP